MDASGEKLPDTLQTGDHVYLRVKFANFTGYADKEGLRMVQLTFDEPLKGFYGAPVREDQVVVDPSDPQP